MPLLSSLATLSSPCLAQTPWVPHPGRAGAGYSWCCLDWVPCATCCWAGTGCRCDMCLPYAGSVLAVWCVCCVLVMYFTCMCGCTRDHMCACLCTLMHPVFASWAGMGMYVRSMLCLQPPCGHLAGSLCPELVWGPASWAHVCGHMGSRGLPTLPCSLSFLGYPQPPRPSQSCSSLDSRVSPQGPHVPSLEGLVLSAEWLSSHGSGSGRLHGSGSGDPVAQGVGTPWLREWGPQAQGVGTP